MLSNRAKRELKINQRRILIDSIEIAIPSPQQILTWGERELPNGKKVGEVKNSKTVNYKKFTPLRDGLFCERIFGPINSFICACGKRQPTSDVSFCDKCEVEYVDKRVRRSRLGYISLVSPVVHVWYLKGRPSYLSLFFGKRKKQMIALAYCNAYLVEQAFPSIEKSRQVFALPNNGQSTRFGKGMTSGTATSISSLRSSKKDGKVGKEKLKTNNKIPSSLVFKANQALPIRTNTIQSFSKVRQFSNLFHKIRRVSCNSAFFAHNNELNSSIVLNGINSEVSKHSQLPPIEKKDSQKNNPLLHLPLISRLSTNKLKPNFYLPEAHFPDPPLRYSDPLTDGVSQGVRGSVGYRSEGLEQKSESGNKVTAFSNFLSKNEEDTNEVVLNSFFHVLIDILSNTGNTTILNSYTHSIPSLFVTKKTDKQLHFIDLYLQKSTNCISFFDFYLHSQSESFYKNKAFIKPKMYQTKVQKAKNVTTFARQKLVIEQKEDQSILLQGITLPISKSRNSVKNTDTVFQNVVSINRHSVPSLNQHSGIDKADKQNGSREQVHSIANRSMLDSFNKTNRNKSLSLDKSNPCFFLQSQTPQKQIKQYNRAQSVPFLPSLICKYNVREELVTFFNSYPLESDIPISFYCEVNRWQALYDVHKFMAEQSLSLSTTELYSQSKIGDSTLVKPIPKKGTIISPTSNGAQSHNGVDTDVPLKLKKLEARDSQQNSKFKNKINKLAFNPYRETSLNSANIYRFKHSLSSENPGIEKLIHCIKKSIPITNSIQTLKTCFFYSNLSGVIASPKRSNLLPQVVDFNQTEFLQNQVFPNPDNSDGNQVSISQQAHKRQIKDFGSLWLLKSQKEAKASTILSKVAKTKKASTLGNLINLAWQFVLPLELFGNVLQSKIASAKAPIQTVTGQRQHSWIAPTSTPLTPDPLTDRVSRWGYQSEGQGIRDKESKEKDQGTNLVNLQNPTIHLSQVSKNPYQSKIIQNGLSTQSILFLNTDTDTKAKIFKNLDISVLFAIYIANRMPKIFQDKNREFLLSKIFANKQSLIQPKGPIVLLSRTTVSKDRVTSTDQLQKKAEISPEILTSILISCRASNLASTYFRLFYLLSAFEKRLIYTVSSPLLDKIENKVPVYPTGNKNTIVLRSKTTGPKDENSNLKYSKISTEKHALLSLFLILPKIKVANISKANNVNSLALKKFNSTFKKFCQQKITNSNTAFDFLPSEEAKDLQDQSTTGQLLDTFSESTKSTQDLGLSEGASNLQDGKQNKPNLYIFVETRCINSLNKPKQSLWLPKQVSNLSDDKQRLSTYSPLTIPNTNPTQKSKQKVKIEELKLNCEVSKAISVTNNSLNLSNIQIQLSNATSQLVVSKTFLFATLVANKKDAINTLYGFDDSKEKTNFGKLNSLVERQSYFANPREPEIRNSIYNNSNGNSAHTADLRKGETKPIEAEMLSHLELSTIREILTYTGGGALEAYLKRINVVSFFDFLNADIAATRLIYKSKLARIGYGNQVNRKQKRVLVRLARRISLNSRRLKIVQLFMRNKRRPEWMMISALPVLPPDLRPILQMSESVVVASDINNLYQRVIYRNNRFHKLGFIDFHLVTAIQRLVQDAVDRLIENGKGASKPFYTPAGRPLKSLSDTLKGKKGRFRYNLLGKRVDFSGRSVIVVSPQLRIQECGLPKEIALELYHYFLLRQLLLKKQASSIVIAKKLIKQRKAPIWNMLRDIIYHHPVLLNRAPTLHRLGIQAFQPKLIDGNAIWLHPLVCSAFNADFDGDQMGVHLPLSIQARAEAWDLLWSRNNLLSPATGQPVLVPSQDMVLGFYYMTQSFASPTLLLQQSVEKQIHSYNQPSNNTTGFATNAFVAFAEQKHSEQKQQKHPEQKQALQSTVSKQSRRTEPKGTIQSPYLDGRSTRILNVRQLETSKQVFFDKLQLLNAFQSGKISIHTPVWLAIKCDEKFEHDKTSLLPLELRINTFANSTYIYSEYKRRKDENTSQITSCIRTTAGKVLVNLFIY